MAHEAKFSVILPAASFSKSRIEEFEEKALHYQLPIILPLQTDANDNLVVASGMSLRDAQALRRKVSECGYTADVISDATQPAQDDFQDDEINTLVLGEHMISPEDSVGDMASDAWDNLEMPDLDLGLSEGEDGQEAGLSDRTQSVSLFELLEAAQSAQAAPANGSSEASSSFSAKLSSPASEAVKEVAEPKPAVSPKEPKSASSSMNLKIDSAAVREPIPSSQSHKAIQRSEASTPKSLDAVPAVSVPSVKAYNSETVSIPVDELAKALPKTIEKDESESSKSNETSNNAEDNATVSISRDAVQKLILSGKVPDSEAEISDTDDNATKSISAEKVKQLLKNAEAFPASPPEIETSGDFPISVACMNIPNDEEEAAHASIPQAPPQTPKRSSGFRWLLIVAIVLILLALAAVIASMFFDLSFITELITKPVF